MAEAAEQRKSQSVDKVDVGMDFTSPPNRVVWSTGRNVRFTPGFVSKTLGKSSLLATGIENPRAGFTFMDFSGNMWTIICTDSNVYTANWDFTAITDITPTSAPSGDSSDRWEFTIVAGLPILTNGKDAIWKWANQTSILIPMNVPIAKHIGCCMHRLVISNVRENGTWYPGRVRWSETGNPENFTIDATKKSGRFDLVNYEDGIDTQHNIMCQITEGSKTYFFTERNLWICDFAQSVKQFIILDPAFELLSSGAATSYRGETYAIDKLSKQIYKYPGREPIGLPVRTHLFENINTGTTDSIFSFPMHGANEIWFCVPTGVNTVPDTAYVYNWELKGWSLCDCDFLFHGVQSTPYYVSWINNSGSTVAWTNISTAVIRWVSARLNYLPSDIVGDSKGNILKMDSGLNALDTSLNSVAIYGLIESGDFDGGGRFIEKIIEDMYLDLDAQTQTNSLYIQVGSRNNLSQPIVWGPAVRFGIGSDFYADLRSYIAQGAFIRFRFYTNAIDAPWSLSGYSFNYSLGRLIR